ncbi:MAG: hypothetical protein RIB65_02640 [Ilumatobacter fluminis]|uniref:hypothetical protein n=1 Tax=Ilumatobacter fluminis TaxID=467091 RepID=UPI0032EF6B95
MSIIDRMGSGMALLRRVLAPRPWVRWTVMVVCSALFLTAVADHRRQVTSARDGWGERRTVWVTDRSVAAGEPITATPTDHPTVVLPDDPVGHDPTGTMARQAIGAGEVVVNVDVAPNGAPADLIPAGWLAVPIVEAAPSSAAIGERVVVTTDGVVVADDGLVVADLGGAPMVAVPAEVAPIVALANESGVTLLRMP